MHRLIAIVLGVVVLVSASLFGQSAPARTAAEEIAHLKATIASLREQVQRQKKEIARLTAAAEPGATRPVTPAQTASRPKPDEPVDENAMLTDGIGVGHIGRLPYPLRVQQVVNATNMIVETSLQTEPPSPHPRGSKESRLLANMPSTMREPSSKVILWISGLLTEGIVDDTSIWLDNLFRVVGTKRFANATGSSTTRFLLIPYISDEPATQPHNTPRDSYGRPLGPGQ